MHIPLTEPTSPPGARYVYINPKTNQVHLFMPVVGGVGIGTDNTCASVRGMQEFFGKSRDSHQMAVLDNLKQYKDALLFDLSLLEEGSEVYQAKSSRLKQIGQYIHILEEAAKDEKVFEGLTKAFPYYPEPLQKLMKGEDSNLYSMVLRPKVTDEYLRFVNPVFTVKRDGEQVLYQALTQAYQGVTPLDTKARLIAKVAGSLAGQNLNFEGMQQALTVEVKTQFNKDVDFTKDSKGEVVTKDCFDIIIAADDSTTAEDYINALINLCAPNLLNDVDESPFHTRKGTEQLSIITQFFLGSVNIYCKMNNISDKNFGWVLDNDKDLSSTVAEILLSMTDGGSIEDALIQWMNENQRTFGMTRKLETKDIKGIKDAFYRNYNAIKDSPHFDEFALLDATKPHPFIHHQGSICLNFIEFIKAGFPGLASDFVKVASNDFKEQQGNIKHTNPHVHASIDISVEELLAEIKTEEQLDAVLKKLPEYAQAEILASPEIKKLQAHKFLTLVAQGRQFEAEQLLKDMPNDAQELLLAQNTFTDYQGRTFNCSAYEYAYWAKDTHMRNMLEKYMDEDTKAETLRRVQSIEKNKLAYQQNGEEKKSPHFDLKPLIDALQAYVDGYDNWSKNKSRGAMGEAWLKVGMAQRDVPVHVINEYCHPDRSFDPCPGFNEETLPRVTTYYNFFTHRDEQLFPLVVSDSEGLGVDFSLLRPLWLWDADAGAGVGRGGPLPSLVLHDLAAISHLDEVRTVDLKQSLETLKSKSPSLGL